MRGGDRLGDAGHHEGCFCRLAQPTLQLCTAKQPPSAGAASSGQFCRAGLHCDSHNNTTGELRLLRSVAGSNLAESPWQCSPSILGLCSCMPLTWPAAAAVPTCVVKHLQMKAVMKELGASFGQLLGQHRAGVVAALMAAAHRTGACNDAVSSSLVSGLKQASQQDARVCLLSFDIDTMQCLALQSARSWGHQANTACGHSSSANSAMVSSRAPGLTSAPTTAPNAVTILLHSKLARSPRRAGSIKLNP